MDVATLLDLAYFGLRQKYCCSHVSLYLQKLVEPSEVKYLVLLATGSQTRFPQIIHDSFLSLLIFVLIRDVIIFTFERLSCGIFSFSGDFADTCCFTDKSSNVVDGQN